MTVIHALPPVAIGVDDFHRLTWLADAVAPSMPDISGFLHRELARSELVEPWFGLVAMGSTVHYRVDSSSSPREVVGKLVYPSKRYDRGNPISILSEEGVALIGLREGQTIRWKGSGGLLRCLTVIRSD